MIQQENEMKELDFTLDGPRIDTRWPVTFAVPFARGELKEEKDLVVYNNEGEGIALQTRPTVYWPDGSIRWLLLDFITDMDRKDPGFRLGEGKPSEEKGLYIHERLNRITVENGSFRAVIPHNGPGLLSEVNFGGDTIIESGGTGGIMESAGRFHTQNSPYNIRVESEGPQHAVITSRGYFTSEGENIFRYEAGVHFYAGLPLIKIDYTVINECPKKEGRPLSEITLDFKLGTDAEGRFGKEKGKSLRQVSADEYELDGDTREGRYAGSIEAEDQLVGVMKDFWQRFPSSLDLEGNTLTFGLLSEQDGEGMLSVQGEAQSREIWLWCGEDGPDGIEMSELVQKRPILISSPRRICETEVFGELEPADYDRHRAYEQGVEMGFEQALKTREERCEYGFRNYGDSRYDAMPRGWLNNEYDWGHAYLLQFARTGDRRYWDFAESRVRHMMDTDIIHHRLPPEQMLIGAPHGHSTDHTAGGVDIGHSWLEGLFDLWSLTGERRALEHGRGMADFYARCVGNVQGPRYKNRPGARRPGWGLIGLMYAYDHTLDEKYLKAAEEIVRVCAREQVDSGAWIYSGGGLDDPRYPVGKTFMVALTLTGMKDYHRVTGEKLAEKTFLKGVDWAIDAMWDEEVGGFRYIDTPHDSLSRSPGSSAKHMMMPLVYAWQLTGDERYRYVAGRTWNKWIEQGQPTLGASSIRDIVHYLPHHEGEPDYQGEFPLLSVSSADAINIRDICFVDEKHGWAAGLYGLLLCTKDGGRSWQRIPLESEQHFYAVDFSGKQGLLAGAGGEVFRTSDGGQNWEKSIVEGVPGSDYHHTLTMIDEKKAYLAGVGHVWKTEDGGKSWERIWDIHSDGRWDKVTKVIGLCAVSPDTIWAVGSYQLAMTIEDEGRSFIARRGLTRGGFDITFINDRLGFAAGPDGRVYRTEDAGESWTAVAGTGKALWAVDFYEETAGYAAGEGGEILVTVDGGKNWNRADTSTDQQLRAISAVSEREAVAGGGNGALLYTPDCGESWRKARIAE